MKLHFFLPVLSLASRSIALNPETGSGAVERRLALDPIAGYVPTSDVKDHAEIDLDQQTIEERLDLAEDDFFLQARNVYIEGGHSFSFAELTLLTPPPNKSFAKGTLVRGINERNENVTGTLLDDATWTGTGAENVTVRVLYDITDDQDDMACQVGGLFIFGDADTRGCFSSLGKAQFIPVNSPSSAESFDYDYNSRRDNNNMRSIQGFSTSAGDVSPYFDDLQLFVNYYGSVDYADKWVLAASLAAATEFTSGRGNADFDLMRGKPGRGRALSMQTGTVVLNIWMAVVRELELATRSCASDSNSATKSLDIAVAYYAGSLEGQAGTDEGVLLHQLADMQARQTKTTRWAGDGVKGTSYVNLEIFYHFGEMQDALSDGDCDTAATLKTDIIRLMKIPLLQSTIVDAWTRSNDDEEKVVEEAKATGATFSAAILPYIHACNSDQADVIYNNMGADSTELDFAAVKGALEAVYACLEVKCAEVGGVWNSRTDSYETGTEPCDDGNPIVARFTEAPTPSPTTSPTMAPTSAPMDASTSEPSEAPAVDDTSSAVNVPLMSHLVAFCLSAGVMLAL